MDPILFKIVLWVGGVAAIASGVGVCVVLAAWWLFARLSAWFDHDEGGSQ